MLCRCGTEICNPPTISGIPVKHNGLKKRARTPFRSVIRNLYTEQFLWNGSAFTPAGKPASDFPDRASRLAGPPEQVKELLVEIKGALFCPGIFYLISISEDAARSFRRRLAAGRDIFESTFDDVLDI